MSEVYTFFMTTPTAEEALALWREYNDDDSLLRHAFAVEAAMRYWAGESGGDPDLWGITGFIHDIDYGRFPEAHCIKAKEILESAGWPEEIVRAAVSHGWGHCTDVEPRTSMEKHLYAVDELTGFIIACALVRPSRSLSDLEPRSVKKKWKDKGFAAGVDRVTIEKGAALLGVNLDELVAGTVEALRDAREKLGL